MIQSIKFKNIENLILLESTRINFKKIANV